MRVSEAGLALVVRDGSDGAPEYLVQWNDKWQRFSLVGGHREPHETFRDCVVREVAEELGLTDGTEFRAAPELVTPLVEYRAVSGAAGVETLYRVELYRVELLTREAVARVDADPANRWLTEPEIRRHATARDAKAVSAQVETVFTLAGVLPTEEEYDLFVSYAHADDADGFVTGLVAALQAEHQQFAREPLRVFYDRAEIRAAQDWESRLLQGLKAAKALLAVLSPAYFDSPWCRREWATFVEHEKERAWPGDPLTPVYAADVPGFDGPDADAKKDWLASLLRIQFCDLKPWRPHGERAFQESAVRKLLKTQLLDPITERLRRVEVTSRSQAHGLPPHNRNFVGREADIARVRKELVFGHVTAVTAVSGIGGIGKTALAAEYAHAFAAEYPGGRFWLPAEGADDLRTLFLRLDTPLGLTLTDDERKNLDRGYGRIRSELERRPGSLVILDNVSDARLFDPAHLSRYRPDGHRVHILATAREEPTRDPEGLVAPVPLDRLSAADGRALLARYRDLGTDDAEWHAAREIVSALDGHALSLEVVGVYLWQRNKLERDFGYVKYRDWMRKKGLLASLERTAKADAVKLSRHTEKVVSTLLSPTLAVLTAAQMRALEYAALMPADWVVIPWLRTLIAAEMPESLVREDDIDPDPWLVLVERLRALRLVVCGNDPRLAKVHRVVQAVVLGRADAPANEERLQKLEALSLQRGEHFKTEWWKAEARWEIEPLRQFCLHGLDGERTNAADLAGWIVDALRLLGRYRQARELISRAIMIEESQLGLDHTNLASRHSDLGNIEMHLGNHLEARRLFLEAIKIEADAFGPDHPNLAIRYSNLSNVELELNNPLEALRLSLRAVEIDEGHLSRSAEVPGRPVGS